MDQFEQHVNETLRLIGDERLAYYKSEEYIFLKAYESVRQYAYEKKLVNTAVSLPVVRALHSGTYRGNMTLEDGSVVKRPYVCHCLAVAQMIINLHIPLTHEEEDIVLSAALCHDIPAYVTFARGFSELTYVYHLSIPVTSLVSFIYTRNLQTEQDKKNFFKRMETNKLAMIVKLADRGNVVEGLYNVSVWKAQEYIHETKTYYMPLCIYAREHYPELDKPLGVLLEKIRSLIDATEVLVMRYVKAEMELTDRILLLKEDNARLRRLLKNEGEGDMK